MNEYLVNPIIKSLVAAIVPVMIAWMFQRSSKLKLTKEKNKLDLLSSFLAWPIENRHHALVEETFTSYFCIRFKYTEIIFTLGLTNPMYVFNLLKSTRRYLTFSEKFNRFELSKGLEDDNTFKRLSNFNLFSYWFFSFISLLPLLFSPKITEEHGLNALVTILFFSVFGLWFAMSFLWENHKMNNAKKVIEQQEFTYKKT